ANRKRGSTKKGFPHLIVSSASGATLLRIAYSRRKCGWPSRGAARMYSAIVAGRLLAISLASIADACHRALTLPRRRAPGNSPDTHVYARPRRGDHTSQNSLLVNP